MPSIPWWTFEEDAQRTHGAFLSSSNPSVLSRASVTKTQSPRVKFKKPLKLTRFFHIHRLLRRRFKNIYKAEVTASASGDSVFSTKSVFEVRGSCFIARKLFPIHNDHELRQKKKSTRSRSSSSLWWPCKKYPNGFLVVPDRALQLL